MSNYDDRNTAQIRIDEMINKYKTRSREAEYLSQKFETDREIYKNIIIRIKNNPLPKFCKTLMRVLIRQLIRLV